MLQVLKNPTQWTFSSAHCCQHGRRRVTQTRCTIVYGAHNKEMIRDECGNYWRVQWSNNKVMLGDTDAYAAVRGRPEIVFMFPHFSVFSPFFSLALAFIKSFDENDGIGNCPGRGCAIRCRSFEGWITSPNSSSHPINCWALLLLSLLTQFNDDCSYVDGLPFFA